MKKPFIISLGFRNMDVKKINKQIISTNKSIWIQKQKNFTYHYELLIKKRETDLTFSTFSLYTLEILKDFKF